MLPAGLPYVLPLPPWVLLAVLLGLINAAACFMLVGRHWSRLAWYAVLGIIAASLGQLVSSAIGAPMPLGIGDLNVLAVSVAASGVILSARLSGL
jgi:hypothetical protein